MGGAESEINVARHNRVIINVMHQGKRVMNLNAIFVGLAMAFAVAGCNSQPVQMPPMAPSQFELHLELPSTFSADSRSEVAISIKNVGESAARLVLPGDGSSVRWRTPIVGWSILKADSGLEHPMLPPFPKNVARCGNINALSRDEIFMLKPGETRDLSEWVAFPRDLLPGSYRVVFYYTNSPGLTWSGVPLGDHDRVAMAQAQSSTSVALASNEVAVVVAK